MPSGRILGSKNKDQTPKYRLTIRNAIDDTESSKDFPTFDAMSNFLETKGIHIPVYNILRYTNGSRPSPMLFTFSKIQ